VSTDYNPLPEVQPPLTAAPAEDPPWTGWDVVRIAVLALVVIGALNVAAMAALRIWSHGRVTNFATNPKILVPIQLVSYMCVVAFMYLIVRSYGREFWSAVRWRWPAAAATYIFAGAVLAIAVQMSSAVLPIPKSLPIEKFFRDRTDAWLMTIFGTTVAPLVEELFFRGFLYPVLARRLGAISGTILTSLGFAVIHQGQLAHAWAPLLLLFAVGLALTIARARTGSVATSFLIHVAYNGTLFTLLYVATDGFRHLERIAQ
jgi:membrane protease YdiL (CAAX protease family)